MKALILEPDAIVALDLLNTLKRLGYKDVCYTCYTQDALAKVKEQHPELIVMDVCLQGAMDGIDVGQQIWKRGNIPIVYLVVYSPPIRIGIPRESG